MVTKLPWNWSPGLIVDAFCTIFQARPVGAGLGAKFGQQPAKNPNKNYNCYYLFQTKVRLVSGPSVGLPTHAPSLEPAGNGEIAFYPAPLSACPTHLAGLSHASCGHPNRTATSGEGCASKSARSDHPRSLGPAGAGQTALVSGPCPTHLAGLSHALCGPPNRTVTQEEGCAAKDQECALGPPPVWLVLHHRPLTMHRFNIFKFRCFG